MEETKEVDRYPWHRLVRTAVLYNAFLAYGITSNLFGPTILDLKVLFQHHRYLMFLVRYLWNSLAD
jgi:hypothetical protein